MQKVLSWGVPNSTEIKNENVGSILFHINAKTSSDAVANLITLNKIEIGLSVKRGTREEVSFFDGYLGDLLQFIHGGTTSLETVLEKTSVGYLVNLQFANRFNIGVNDVLRVKTNFGSASASFTSATNSNSTIVIYTNPSSVENPQNYVAVYKSFQIPTGDVDFQKHLGTNIGKIMFHAHPSASFDAVSTAGTDPLPLSSEIVADNYTEDKSQVELLASAQMSLSYNPDSDVYNLVQYESANILSDVRVKIKLSAPATINTKVLVTSYTVL
tara:strand:+ start:50 stop:862 length:813 start_codon:yes stop_codon:yes gene_type:complete